jgi:hypothetical protein
LPLGYLIVELFLACSERLIFVCEAALIDRVRRIELVEPINAGGELLLLLVQNRELFFPVPYRLVELAQMTSNFIR